jgi:hypothetical protein
MTSKDLKILENVSWRFSYNISSQNLIQQPSRKKNQDVSKYFIVIHHFGFNSYRVLILNIMFLSYRNSQQVKTLIYRYKHLLYSLSSLLALLNLLTHSLGEFFKRTFYWWASGSERSAPLYNCWHRSFQLQKWVSRLATPHGCVTVILHI